MKKILFISVLSLLLFNYSNAQTSDEYNSIAGITYKKGDTLTFAKRLLSSSYMGIYKGKRISENKRQQQNISRKKCIISVFQEKDGTSYAICKDLEKNLFTVDILMALTMQEIEITEKQKLSVRPVYYSLFNISDPKKEISEKSKTDSSMEYEPFNFQGVTWKTTMQELENLFPDIKRVGEFYVKEDLVNGLDTELVFEFKNELLKTIMYTFKTEHSNRNIYIEDYLKIKEILIEKYGEPEKNIEKWRRDLYKDDYQDYGMAIAIGDLEYRTIWNLPDVGILLNLIGDNYKIEHTMIYLNKSKSQSSDTKNKEVLKKF